ncbi:MAG TPA: VOC family protein [Brevundimonas sp.]|nr:VOC family protein [Brevundimonas sp.]
MTKPAETSRPLVSHVSVGVTDLHRAGAFYDAVLAVVGARRIMEHGSGIGYGRSFPEFWANVPRDGRGMAGAAGAHVCFNASGPEAVVAFHEAGLAAGGFSDGLPGPRPEYAPGYYAAFLRDPDGNKVEAMCWIVAAETA